MKETRCGYHVAAVGLVKGMRVLLSRARRGLKGGGGGDGEGGMGREGASGGLCAVCVCTVAPRGSGGGQSPFATVGELCEGICFCSCRIYQ